MKIKEELDKRFIQVAIIYRAVIFLLSLLRHPANRSRRLNVVVRIPWWMVNKFFIKVPCVVEIVPGVKCICYPGKSLFSGLVFYMGLPEYYEMNFLLKVLRDTDIFIDVGANIGVYTLLAASRIKKGKVYAFEPSIKSLDRLRTNILLNDFGSVVEVYDQFVSDREGYQYFDIGNEPDYNHLALDKKGDFVKRVRSKKLDIFIREKKIEKIRAIKIDVEGVEFLVVKGLEKSLREGVVDILIVEITEWMYRRFGFSALDTTKFLRECGFELYVFDSSGKLVKLGDSDVPLLNLLAIRKEKVNDILKLTKT